MGSSSKSDDGVGDSSPMLLWGLVFLDRNMGHYYIDGNGDCKCDDVSTNKLPVIGGTTNDEFLRLESVCCEVAGIVYRVLI
jgi:hypothetical protein